MTWLETLFSMYWYCLAESLNLVDSRFGSGELFISEIYSLFIIVKFYVPGLFSDGASSGLLEITSVSRELITYGFLKYRSIWDGPVKINGLMFRAESWDFETEPLIK